MASRALASNKPEQAKPIRRGARRRRRNELDFDVLSGHLGYFLRRLQIRVFQDFIRAFAAMNVRPAQYSALVLIGANPGSSQAAIAEALHVERARFARLLNDLERRGWTTRVPARNDGRSHALHLTPAGHKALGRLKCLGAQHERHVGDFVGARRRNTLIVLLKDLHRRTSQGGQD